MPKYKAVTLELPKEDEPFELPEGIIPLQVWPGANGMVLICLLPFNEEQADVEEKNTTSIEEEGPPITNRESTNGDSR